MFAMFLYALCTNNTLELSRTTTEVATESTVHNHTAIIARKYFEATDTYCIPVTICYIDCKGGPRSDYYGSVIRSSSLCQ